MSIKLDRFGFYYVDLRPYVNGQLPHGVYDPVNPPSREEMKTWLESTGHSVLGWDTTQTGWAITTADRYQVTNAGKVLKVNPAIHIEHLAH